MNNIFDVVLVACSALAFIVGLGIGLFIGGYL